MASPGAAARSVSTGCRLMGAAWQLGCTWRLISQGLSNALNLCCPDHRSPAHPSVASASCSAGLRASTAISCPSLVEIKEGQELKQQGKRHQKRQRQWERERLSWLSGLSPERGKAAGFVGFLPSSGSLFYKTCALCRSGR